MARYADFFLLAIPKGKLPLYRPMTRLFGKVIKEYGALAYSEYVEHTIEPKMQRMLGRAVALKPGEKIIFSYVEFASKAARDRAMKLLMADPRLQVMMKKKPPFDMKRMIYGGFSEIYRMK